MVSSPLKPRRCYLQSNQYGFDPLLNQDRHTPRRDGHRAALVLRRPVRPEPRGGVAEAVPLPAGRRREGGPRVNSRLTARVSIIIHSEIKYHHVDFICYTRGTDCERRRP